MSRPESSEIAAHPATLPRGSAGLWFAVLGPPAVWFVSLVVSYFGVHEVCRVNSPLAPRVVSVVALVLVLAAGLVGRAIWVGAAAHERTRFLAQIGVLSSAVFSLIILLQVIATFLLPACHDRPRTPQSPDVWHGPSQRQSLT
jgi:hypothetical protein